MSLAPDRVLVVIARTRHKMFQVEMQEAARRGAKFIELRLDFLAKAVDFKRLQEFKSTPWVATVRRPTEGGRWSGTEEERQTLLRQAIAAGCFEWVDLEYDIAKSIRRFGKVKRIISYHNMDETPANLGDIYKSMLEQDGDVYKIAVMADSPADVGRVLELQRNAPKPTVAFCMGEIGFPSRFINMKFGAPWVYAAFNRERGLAPGMPTYDDIRTKYPARSIKPDTEFFGVMGDPIGHSHSPILHNHMYRKLKANAIYLPFRVPPTQFTNSVQAYDQVPISGYSVTIPHKVKAKEFSGPLSDELVNLTGAANTLVRQADGKFRAYNTDVAGAIESIREHFAKKSPNGIVDFNRIFVLILGAGGAARAIAHGLHREGAHISICSRTSEKSAELAAEVHCKSIEWTARNAVTPCDLLINCTPVGMYPNVDDSPIHQSFLKPGLTVFDTVYNPEITMMIREAQTRGAEVITGVNMFVRQAAYQIEHFTGNMPPVGTMMELLRKAMSPLTGVLGEAEPAESDQAEQQGTPSE